MICSAGYSASSGLPRTLGPNVAMVMMTIAAVIRPNTPPTPASRYVVRETHCCVVARAFIVACLDYI
jgi:hypothetical protein